MSNEIKYTNDGKKVLVVGRLNTQETIVQEIFVQGEVEVSSGENFVVKSLHDKPSITWKEKKLKELEERYTKEKERFENQLTEQRKRFNGEIELYRNRTQYLKSISADHLIEAFERVDKLLTGKINYIVTDDYNGFHLKAFDKAIELKDRFENSMKLITLFGRPDRSLQFRIDRYSDGSGGSRNEIQIFETEKEALKYIRVKCNELAKENGINEALLKTAERYGFTLPKESLLKYYKNALESSEKSLEGDRKLLKNKKKKVAEYADLIAELEKQ